MLESLVQPTELWDDVKAITETSGNHIIKILENEEIHESSIMAAEVTIQPDLLQEDTSIPSLQIVALHEEEEDFYLSKMTNGTDTGIPSIESYPAIKRRRSSTKNRPH